MAQAIAKILKSASGSVDEKIKIATQAWNSADILFPHKDEFLLEWLCTSLFKSVGKGTERLVLRAFISRPKEVFLHISTLIQFIY